MIEIFLTLILIFAPIARGAVRIWAFAPIQILTLLVSLFCVFKLASNRDPSALRPQDDPLIIGKNTPRGQITIRRTSLDMPILLFFIVFAISSFTSVYIYGSFMEFLRLLNLALIFYIVVNFIRSEAEIKRLLTVIVAIGAGIALFGILQYLGVIQRSWWSSPVFLSATFVNHNHFAGFIGLIIPLSIGMILSEKDTGKKALYIYSFLILSAAALLSMSRGGWFSLAISMFFMLGIILRKGRIRFVTFILILSAIAVGIFIFNAADLPVLLERVSSYRELDFSGRLSIWEGTVGIIKDNWVSGTGPGTFIHNFPRYRPAGLNRLINYAHNDYLEVFSDMGIFGLGLMIFIIVSIIKKGLTTYSVTKDPFKKWISLSLATGILGMAIHSIGDFNLRIPSNAILFTVFSALLFNIYSKMKKECPLLVLRPRPVTNIFIKSCAAILMFTLIALIYSSLMAEAYSTISEKELSRNDLEKAQDMAVKAMKFNLFNYQYPYRLAGIYSRMGYFTRSERFYEEAIQLNPIDSWSWIGLGNACHELYKHSLGDGNINLAGNAYEKALELDPLNSYYLKTYGKFMIETDRPSLAVEAYKKAAYVMSKSETLSILPKGFTDGESYLRAASMAFSSQDIDQALVYYKMASEFLEDNEASVLGQVRCYLRLLSLEKAMSEFKKIQPSKRNESIWFASLGDYYLRKGEIDKAKTFSEKSISLDPKNPEGYQLRYKMLKQAEDMTRIIDFNHLPLSYDLRPGGGVDLEFELNKGLHKEGSLIIDVVLPAGIYEFDVRAKGKSAKGIWPHMALRCNNENAVDVFVNDSDWKDYSGIIVVDYPVNSFEIIFDNDYYDEKTMEDRNLYVDSIRLSSLTAQASQ
ncbi:MAG: O-antigen ligase family protein [Candidatus Omnitrophica bacterium]|nr:O-antigen ligase family protein [Candidatus Omnitrophota bacterium]MBU4457116.1 O-antigen ligase family protein [Candidatus Omnitrophota bacterium]